MCYLHIERIWNTCLLAFILVFFDSGICGTLVYYPTIVLNWNDARAFCQSEGMDLATIEDSVEMARVGQCITDTGGFAGDVWIGGYYDTLTSTLRWTDNSILSITHPEWDLSIPEPDCLTSAECSTVQHCIRIISAPKMRTYYCTSSFSVLCEADNPSTNCIDPSATTTTTSTLAPPLGEQTKKSGLSTGAIIGLVVGFISFIVLVSCCVCIWKTFCGITDEDKIAPDPDGIHTITLSEGATQQLHADNPWLRDEEVSFCLREKYTFQMEYDIGGKRSRYIK